MNIFNFFKKKENEKNEFVEPIDENLTDVVKDIIAGLKNALMRGENINNAMQSIVNAGYDVNSVILASNYVNNITFNQRNVNNLSSTPVEINNTNKVKFLSKKVLGLKMSYFLIILSLSIIFLIGALILGLNWSKII